MASNFASAASIGEASVLASESTITIGRTMSGEFIDGWPCASTSRMATKVMLSPARTMNAIVSEADLDFALETGTEVLENWLLEQGGLR